jgi:hypothetical protein
VDSKLQQSIEVHGKRDLKTIVGTFTEAIHADDPPTWHSVSVSSFSRGLTAALKVTSAIKQLAYLEGNQPAHS